MRIPTIDLVFSEFVLAYLIRMEGTQTEAPLDGFVSLPCLEARMWDVPCRLRSQLCGVWRDQSWITFGR